MCLWVYVYTHTRIIDRRGYYLDGAIIGVEKLESPLCILNTGTCPTHNTPQRGARIGLRGFNIYPAHGIAIVFTQFNHLVVIEV